MANEKSVKVGCGGVKYNGNERQLTCNYSFTNALGSAVYETGKAGSKCRSGMSETYPNLCSKNEHVDYKKLN